MRYAPSYEVKLAHTLGEAFSRADYDDLLKRTEIKSVFDSWSWIAACYEQTADTPIIVGVFADGKLVAAAPLKIGWRKVAGLSIRILCFAQHPLGDQMTLPADPAYPGAVDALFAFLTKTLRGYDALILEEVRRRSATGAASGMAPPPDVKTEEIRRTPVILYRGETRAAHAARYSKSLKRKLQRCRNKLARHHATIAIGRVAPDEVPALLAEMKAIEDTSWKGGEQVGIFSSEDRFRLFNRISDSLSQDGHLYAGRILIDGAAITYRFGFAYEGVVYDYNLAFKEEFSQLGAGRLLLDEMILAAADEGFIAFDGSRTGRGTANLLVERDVIWVPHERWLWFRPTARGLYARLVFMGLKPAGRALKRRLRRRPSQPDAQS